MLIFAPYDPEVCCLCGAKSPLTAEHKFKASQIKSAFPDSELLSISNPVWRRPKNIQGPKSDNLKFKKSVCASCNNDRTQAPDRAFDEFQRANKSDLSNILKERESIGEAIRPVTTSNERNVFRYFAKLLCCFMAEIDGPRPRAVGAFAAGFSDLNPIILSVSQDPAPAELQSHGIESEWVAHGGLMLLFDRSKCVVEEIGSRLTIGEVRYEYWIKTSKLAQLELYLFHRAFLERAKQRIIE